MLFQHVMLRQGYSRVIIDLKTSIESNPLQQLDRTTENTNMLHPSVLFKNGGTSHVKIMDVTKDIKFLA